MAARAALPRARDLTVSHADAAGFLAAARARSAARSPNLPAPGACIDALAASLGPFDAGLEKERALFTQLLQGPESAALRHAFFAERAAAKVPGLPAGTQARAIRSAAVVGAGTMGGGIAMCFASAGMPVIVLEENAAALAHGLALVRRNYEEAVHRGKLSATDMQRRLALMRGTLERERSGIRRRDC